MLIGQIAAVARVSPRSIRHYHRVGVLPEPDRSSNGYRVYSVMDLTRLLRIRRLLALGLPLHRIKAVIEDEPDRAVEDELEELEHDLVSRIDGLHAQLEAVRSARSSLLPETVVLYDGNHEALSQLWSVPGVRRIERDVGLLLAAAGNTSLLEQLRKGLEDVSRLEDIGKLIRGLRSIRQDSSAAERDAVIAELGQALAPWVSLEVGPQLHDLVQDYLEQAFGSTHLDVIRRAAEVAEADYKRLTEGN